MPSVAGASVGDLCPLHARSDPRKDLLYVTADGATSETNGEACDFLRALSARAQVTDFSCDGRHSKKR